MKQISNFKFYDMNDATIKVGIDGRSIKNNNGTVKVIDPNGDTLYMSEKDANILYKRLYAAKNVDKIVENALKEVGLTVKNAHLYDYKTLKRFENLLECSLRKEGIDLSFMPETITNKYGFHISGNVQGICADILGKLWRWPWKEFKVTKGELKKYLEDNPKISVYRKGEYYSVVKIDKSELFKNEYGRKFENQGVGSCASVREVIIELKKDEEGNILLEKNVMIWD